MAAILKISLLLLSQSPLAEFLARLGLSQNRWIKGKSMGAMQVMGQDCSGVPCAPHGCWVACGEGRDGGEARIGLPLEGSG